MYGRTILSACFIILASACPADVITVNWDGSADYTTIQPAINAATDGDEVVVADGTYTGDGNRDIDFLGKAIILRSQNGPDTCIINCQGSEDNRHRGFTFQSGEDPNSVIDGFTIINGHTVGGSSVYCYLSSPVIRDCVFKNNTADWLGGGAMYNNKSNPLVENCRFVGNSALVSSGGGGAVCNDNSSPAFYNCTFTDNWSAMDGGAIYHGSLSYVPEPTLLFGDQLLVNCLLTGNKAVLSGGAIYSSAIEGFRSRGSLSKLLNCTVAENLASSAGGLIDAEASLGIKWGVYVVTNSIVWANADADGMDEHAQIDARTAINYSCVQGWTGDLRGEGNIGYDPVFVQAGCWDDNDTPDDWNDDTWIEGNYRLQPWSLCVDSGDPDYVTYADDVDLDGNARVVDGDNDDFAVIDMGAYESTVYDEPIIRVSNLKIDFHTEEGGSSYAERTIIIHNGGGGILKWHITENCDWLSVWPLSSSSKDRLKEVVVSVDSEGMSRGLYKCIISIESDDAVNSPVEVEAFLYLNGIVRVPSQYPTIQSAIDAANNGDTVIIYDGTYTGQGNRDMTFNGKAITVRSEKGPDTCIIDCQGTWLEPHIGFRLDKYEDANSIVDGFQIINGNSGYFRDGGALQILWSSPTITNCIFKNNVSNGGGAVDCVQSSAKISECAFKENYAHFTGAGIESYYSSPFIENCTFLKNGPIDPNMFLPRGGGAFFEHGSPIIRGCVFKENNAGTGGGIYAFDSVINISDCLFVLNSGGAVNNLGSEFSIIESVFEQNFFSNGGAISNLLSEGSVINCRFSANEACQTYPDLDGNGGAMYNLASSPVIKGSLFSRNYAARGGAIFNDAGFPRILNCAFLKNQSQGSGGAIYSGSIAFVNSANFNYEDKTIVKNCVFSGNTASTVGGTICNTYVEFIEFYIPPVGCNLSVSNSTFTGNLASETAGLWCSDFWPREVILTDNIFRANADAEGMSEAAQVYGGNPDINFCCIQGWTGDLGGEGNIGENPSFIAPGSWDDNGTPDVWYDDIWIEGDYHLQQGSPCIDTGDPNYIPTPDETDLDKNPRVLDGNSDGTPRIDMGAYEYMPPVVIVPVDVKITPSVLNVNSEGKFVVAHVTLPEDLSASTEDIEIALLEDQIEAVWIELSENDEGLLIVKFDRTVVSEFIVDTGLLGELEFTVSLALKTGEVLEGKDIIKVIEKPET